MRADRFLLVSHDGFGLGHTRRNVCIAEVIRNQCPDAAITIVTGIASTHSWLDDRDFSVVRVPEVVKNVDGQYVNPTMSLSEALSRREQLLCDVVRVTQPQVVLVDRHPYGVNNEWRRGLTLAKSGGAAIAVGLRDILDEAEVVRAEFAGSRWAGVGGLVDEVLVYGNQSLCDHQREYGLPLRPFYCGWVTDTSVVATRVIDPGLLVVTAGGGADGNVVTEIGCVLARHGSIDRAIFVMGPAGVGRIDEVRLSMSTLSNVEVKAVVSNCFELFAEAGVVLEMAGYNSTIEALAAGSRPILVPRRAPRREQAIRATRLASLGLADVVDHAASPDEVSWLLARPRRLDDDALSRHGLALTGAEAASHRLLALC